MAGEHGQMAAGVTPEEFARDYPFPFFHYAVDRASHIATVTLRNPDPRKGNIAPFFAESQLTRLVDAWERDDDVKVVVILADGDHFCSGHDMGEYLSAFHVRDQDAADARRHRPSVREQLLVERDMHKALERVLFSLKPIITGVQGRCLDFGTHLQTFSDISIAAEDAHLGSLGQTAGASGISWLRIYASLIGVKRAREMWLTGRTWSGRDAALIGLVNRAVPHQELREAVYNEARRIALLPIDGLVTGKAYTQMVLESMGFGKAASELYLAHVLGLKTRFESDEFWFFDEIRRNGLQNALRDRKERYAKLGGFGDAAEEPIVPQ
jgi:enoyl-CoA hydratase